jgi:hypothetical protein
VCDIIFSKAHIILELTFSQMSKLGSLNSSFCLGFMLAFKKIELQDNAK